MHVYDKNFFSGFLYLIPLVESVLFLSLCLLKAYLPNIIRQFAKQIQGGRPSLIQIITFTFSFLIWHLFTSWSITFSTTNPTFLSLWLPLPQGISWRTHADTSISFKNSLPNHRTEEKSGYLEGVRHRAPILWHTRLRLTLLICWQGPTHSQIQ